MKDARDGPGAALGVGPVVGVKGGRGNEGKGRRLLGIVRNVAIYHEQAAALSFQAGSETLLDNRKTQGETAQLVDIDISGYMLVGELVAERLAVVEECVELPMLFPALAEDQKNGCLFVQLGEQA